MDRGSPSLCACVMMVSLLGAARCSSGGENKCKCQGIPPFPLTKDPLSSCSEIPTSFRYTCIEGYVRKAGTSNRIICNQVYGNWTTPNLECIPDPRRPQPPKSTVTQGNTDITLDIITTTVKIPSSTTTRRSRTTSATSTRTPVTRIASTSVTAATEKTESTSPDLQVSSRNSTRVNLVTKTEETQKSTSTTTSTTTTEASTVDLQLFEHRKLSSTSTALISLASLAIVCALIGLAFKIFYRRSKQNTCNQPSEEEQIPMNPPPKQL